MNAFEEIVKLYLEVKGYWVRQGVKVEISKEDKKAIGLPTMPRPEIDLVALNVRENELLLIEVKSFLDSHGVGYEDVSNEDGSKPSGKNAKRYRLFTDSKHRRVVTKKLREQYLQEGLINENTKVNYALAAGNIHSPTDESEIEAYFIEKGWKLFSPREIKDAIKALSQRGWEDNPITISAKLVLRD